MIIYEEILREFQKQKVRYVLVGGIAMNLHGSLRNTVDMDILVEMSDENLAKVVTILKGQGYRVKQPVDPMGIANPKIRSEWINGKNMKAFNFYKDRELKEVDIIIDSPVSYESAFPKAEIIKIGDIRLPLISIDDLIKMKTRAGRNVDQLDVVELKKIKKLRGEK